MTDYQKFTLAFSIFQFLVTSGIGIYVWWTNRDKITNTRFKEIEGRIIVLETVAQTVPELKLISERLTKIETEVKTGRVCGNHDRMEANDVKLFERFDELHGDLRGLAGEMKSLVGAVNMINEHLINGRK